MLQPKKTKFRRCQKGRIKGNAQRGTELAFGTFGIKSLGTIWLTGRQIEAARIAVTRYMQRQGQVWIHIVNMCRYFNKWGWFRDKERQLFNDTAIREYL